MDLAWVLLIRIRSLLLFLCSQLCFLFLFFRTLHTLLIFLLVGFLFLCVLCFSFLQGDEDVAILEGGTCDRVILPRPRDLW